MVLLEDSQVILTLLIAKKLITTHQSINQSFGISPNPLKGMATETYTEHPV